MSWPVAVKLGRTVGAFTVLLVILGLTFPAAAQDQNGGETVTIPLAELNDSGVSGVAMLSPNGDQTDVSVRLTGAFDRHPNHIHQGWCDDVVPEPLFPLTHFVIEEADPDGFANSTVDIRLRELLRGEYSILVHVSDDQLDQYIACGNIGTPDEQQAAAAATEEPQAAATEEPQAAATPPVDLGAGSEPAVGVSETPAAPVSGLGKSGVGSDIASNSGLVVLLAGLAALCAAVAIGTALRTRLHRNG